MNLIGAITSASAMAVAPPQTLLGQLAGLGAVVSLEVPEMLRAIGNHFRDLAQISDEDVVEVLKARTSSSQPPGSGFQP